MITVILPPSAIHLLLFLLSLYRLTPAGMGRPDVARLAAELRAALEYCEGQ